LEADRQHSKKQEQNTTTAAAPLPLARMPMIAQLQS